MLQALLAFQTPVRSEPIADVVAGPPGLRGLTDMIRHPDQWPAGRDGRRVLLLADHTTSALSDTELDQLGRALSVAGIGVEIETAAIKSWAAMADQAFAIEVKIWNRLIKHGFPIRSFVLDEPFVASVKELHRDRAFAMEQTSRFIGQLRTVFPAALVGDVEPYPYFSFDEHVAWLTGVQQRLRQQGTRPLDFYRIDPDWIAFPSAQASNRWLELKALSTKIDEQRVAFSMILWASDIPSLGSRADETSWYCGVMRQARNMRDADITAAQLVMEDWLQWPATIVPETAPFSFSAAIRDALTIIRGTDRMGTRVNPNNAGCS